MDSFRSTSGAQLQTPIGFGTFEASPENESQSVAVILEALRTGYRLIDTAALYGSEAAVGKAIKQSGIPREEIIICTKFWNHMHRPHDVKRSLEHSLEQLDTDYVDLYLMHFPVAFERNEEFQEAKGPNGKPIVDEELSHNHEPTWKAMEDLVASGKCKAIGVSNFTIEQLQRLLSFARIRPSVNQVESHPWLPQHDLLQFCQQHGIAFMAYSPLGSQAGPAALHVIKRSILEDSDVQRTAEELGVEPAQVLLAWAIKRGSVPVPKSATPHRIRSNFNLIDLPEDIFQRIDTITSRDPSRTMRFVDFDELWGTKQWSK